MSIKFYISPKFGPKILYPPPKKKQISGYVPDYLFIYLI